MKKPTKGPWKVHVDGLRIVGADGYELCGIADCSEDEGGRPGEDQANARLIASAPAMLRALKAFVKLRKGDLGPDLGPLERAIKGAESRPCRGARTK